MRPWPCRARRARRCGSCSIADEEQLDSGNRPATVQRLRVGARRDGTLSAIAIDTYGTAGVGLGAGVGNFAQSIYDCANFDIAQSDVFINAGPGCAMRAPGNVPGAFALEQTIDELAEKLAMDPLALRDRIDPSAVRREERRIGAARFGWSRRHAPGADSGPIKRGVGMAQSYWGANVHTNASCEVRIMRDGSVELLSSVQDIGTGIGTVLAQVVAEELGLRPEDIVDPHRRHRLPGGAAVVRQHDHGLDHAAGAQRGAPGAARAVRGRRAGARRGAGKSCRAWRAHCHGRQMPAA